MIGRLWHRQPVALIGFVLALAVAGFFAWRFVDRAIYWSDSAHIHQAPQPWMTLGYVARSWLVDPHDLATALNLDPGAQRGRRLEEIAADQGVPVQEVIDRLNARLAQETLSPPPPEPTRP